jgi:putative pyrroloquinoline-quinone binding quinoprotein
VRCPECMQQTADVGQFCVWCGAPAGMPGNPAYPVVPRPRRAIWRRPEIIALAASVALISLLTAIAVISGKPGGPTTRGTPAMQATSARWTYTTGSYIDTRPAVAGGTVYAGSDDGTVYALDAATGRLRWTYTAGDSVSDPAVAGGTVYVGSLDFKVYALDAATGGLRWAYTTGSYVLSSPAVAGGTVYIGSFDGRVHALAARL